MVLLKVKPQTGNNTTRLVQALLCLVSWAGWSDNTQASDQAVLSFVAALP